MFAKLLKHEWEANSGLLGILSLAVMGVSVLVTVLLRFATADNVHVPDIVMVPVVLLIIGGFLAMLVYSLGVQIIMLARFYKNKFTDEGYLTFTLPVTTHQILLSSLLNYLFWTIISTVVTVIAFAIPIVVGTTHQGLINQELLDAVTYAFRIMMAEEGMAGYTTIVTISSVISVLSSLILVHTAIVLGCVMAKKHKILASFGFYYGISMVLSTVTSVLTFGVTMMDLTLNNGTDVFGAMNGVMIIQMVIFAVVAVVGYFLSHHLMKNKLNLP